MRCMMRGVEGGMIDRRRLFFESYPDELSVLLLVQASWGICTRIVNKQLNQIHYKEGRRKVVIQNNSHEEQTVPEDSLSRGQTGDKLEKFSMGS